MSHLGMKILYHILNKREEFYCERVFAPWMDMERAMRENQIPLYSLETFTPVRDFDLVGFTLQYEMSYTNVLNMLDLAGIPMTWRERDAVDAPFVVCGRPCAFNPEPLRTLWTCSWWATARSRSWSCASTTTPGRARGGTREEFLLEMANIEGNYVPRFYEAQYDGAANLQGLGAARGTTCPRASASAASRTWTTRTTRTASSCPSRRSCTTGSCWRWRAAARAAAASARRGCSTGRSASAASSA